MSFMASATSTTVWAGALSAGIHMLGLGGSRASQGIVFVRSARKVGLLVGSGRLDVDHDVG